jgi:hypothetical protein
LFKVTEELKHGLEKIGSLDINNMLSVVDKGLSKSPRINRNKNKNKNKKAEKSQSPAEAIPVSNG